VIGLWIFFGVKYPFFFTKANIENLFTGVSILWVVAMGMTFVVLTAGIDLSVGSMLALAGFILEALVAAGVPSVLSIGLTVAAAAALGGLVNGLPIGWWGLSFFVVTLASMSVITGVVNLWSNTQTFYINSQLVGSIGLGHIANIPVPIWIMIVTFLLSFVVLRFTLFGRDIYAVGGNIKAARLSGIHVSRTIVAVYAISAGSAGIGTLIEAGRLGAASPLVGTDLPLQAAAGVLLGGTSFVGGVGGVLGTAVGVTFIGTLQNGLGIAGLSDFWQEVITGVILFTAVAVDKVRQNREALMRLRRRLPTRLGASRDTPPDAPLGAGQSPDGAATTGEPARHQDP
jgi:ribose/xylose/arabinose/galactoside ABC-type transport system permease subunit